jgi:glycosyltransferase involved in cell wall biosynthesis
MLDVRSPQLALIPIAPTRQGDSGDASPLPDALNAPLVSVITPCYRQGRFLADAIESVRAQDYRHVEHIVVNDGSDDDTDDVAARYATTIRYISKPNGGLSSARNAGLQAARGTFAIFLDADDLLAPGAISALVHATRGRDSCLVVGGWRHFSVRADDGPKASFPARDHQPLRLLIDQNIAPIHACLVSVEAVKAQGGFDENLEACEDWDAWLSVVAGGATIVAVDDVVACYRNTPNSVSKDARRMLAARVHVLLRMHDVVLSSPAHVADVGVDLLNAEIRVLRRLLVRRVTPPDLTGRLRNAIDQLKRCGVTGPASPLKRLANHAFGTYAEDLVLMVYRLISPSMLQHYRDGWL